jgi:Zn-dependent protease
VTGPRPGALTFVRPSAIFIALLAVTAITGGALYAGSTQRWLVFVFVLAGWVVSLSFHEFGHAVTAYRGGDSSVVGKGYLSLDPRRYTHPLLSIGLPILFVLAGGIGLPGGAVWIDRAAIRERSALSAVSAAGPVTNLALAVVLLYPLGAGWIEPGSRVFFATGLAWLGVLQIAAAFLNLLPIPGLDGYGIIEPYLPPEFRARVAPIAGWSVLLVFFLLWRVDALNEFFWDRVLGLADLLGVRAIFPVCGQFTFEFWETLPPVCAG